jgi:hypothetical protein
MARTSKENALYPVRIPSCTIFDMLAAIEGLHLEVYHKKPFAEVLCSACGVHIARIRHHRTDAAVIARYCPICLANWEYSVS